MINNYETGPALPSDGPASAARAARAARMSSQEAPGETCVCRSAFDCDEAVHSWLTTTLKDSPRASGRGRVDCQGHGAVPRFGSSAVDHLNDACRMKVAKRAPSWRDDRRLLQIYNNVRAPRPLVDNASVCDLHCVVCRASESKFCHCGAGLAVAKVELNRFVPRFGSSARTRMRFAV